MEKFEKMVKEVNVEMCLAFMRERENANYHDAEEMVIAVLRADNFNLENHDKVLEAALTAFFNSRDENNAMNHGQWVHSLSHFIDKLWEYNMLDWVKKYYEAAFKGSVELNNSNCCDRLINSFNEYDNGSMAPAEFGLTLENLKGVQIVDKEEPAKYESAIKRSEAGKFATEVDFLIWKLRNPDVFKGFYMYSTDFFVHVEDVEKTITRLNKIGSDSSEYVTLIKGTINYLIEELTPYLKATKDYYRERAEKTIKELSELLD